MGLRLQTGPASTQTRSQIPVAESIVTTHAAVIAALAILLVIVTVRQVLRWRDWSRKKEALRLALAPMLAGTAPIRPLPYLLWWKPYLVMSHEQRRVRLVLGDYERAENGPPGLDLRLRFDLTGPAAFRARLHLVPEGQSRPHHGLVALLNRPMLTSMRACTTGDDAFDGRFEQHSNSGPRFRSMMTSDVRGALLLLADDLRELDSIGPWWSLRIMIDEGRVQFRLQLPTEWLPPSQFVVGFCEVACETQRVLQEACTTHGGG